MTRDELKQAIVEEVNQLRSCKTIELVTALVESLSEWCGEHDLLDVIDEMIISGQLVEVQYVLPDMDYRVKSILFPGGTEIVRKENDNV